MSFFVWFTGATEASGTPSAAGTPIGLPAEADSATALGKAKVKAIGLATEIDTPSAFGHGSKEIGLPSSAHTALALGRKRTRSIGLATETGTAIVARPVRATAIGLAPNNQFVIGLRRVRTHKVGQPSTTTSALPMVPALSGGGGALWTPAQITAGMVSWLDAADAPQLVFSGSNLTQWKDKSPAANHAVPFVTGPTLTSINSLGSLAFSAQGLHAGAAISLGDFTVFAVFKALSTGSFERLVDQDFANGFWLGRNATAAAWGGGVRNVTDPYGYYVTLADGETHQVMTRRSGATQYVSGNGGAVATSGAVTTTPTASQWIAIGTGYDNIVSDRLDNDVISEILVWSNSLSADDQAKTEGYLAWKWGIEAKLPVGHPYKNAPPTVPVDEDWGPEESAYDPSLVPEFIIDDYYECNFGNKFRVLANGRITGIRHYNSPGAFSSRLVCLWSEAGVLLASGTTTGDVDGWNTFEITPVNVSADQIIWASYGHHGEPDVWSMGFDVPLVSDSPNLEWLLGGQAETGTGHYDDFPLYEDDTTHHFADVVFQESLATGVTIPIGQPAVVDAATPLGRAKVRAIGQVIEADTTPAIGKAKTKAIGQPSSATTATPLGRAKLKAIGQPSSAHTATATGKTKRKATGLPSSATTALALTRAKSKAIGQPSTTHTALALGKAKVKAIGLAAEIDSTLPMGSLSEEPVGPASVLVLTFTPGTDRNDFTGQVGVRLGIGGANIPFKWMGMRRHHINQTGNHTVRLFEWFGDTQERSAVIDLTDVEVGDWGWAEVDPYVMLAGGYYALLMDVTAFDGQTWCNPGPVGMVAGITNIYDCYRAGGTLGTGTPNGMFNGLDLGAGDVGKLTIAINQIAETDTALISRPRRARTIGLPIEADAARSLTRRVKISLATDTSSTTAAVRAKRRTLALPLEANTTAALKHPKSKAIGLASSTHTALPPTRVGSSGISPAIETNSAPHPTARRARAIGLPADTATALPLRRVRSKAIGIAAEADTATLPKRTKLKAIGTTAEATSAPPVGRVRRRGTATASEADSARSLTHARAKAIGQATEADIASRATIPGFFRMVLEADSTFPLGRAKAKAIGQATEAGAATEIRPRRIVQIGIVTDISIPLAVGYGRSATIGIAEENDRATGMRSVAIGTPPHRIANAPAASRTAVAGPARSRTADVVARSREATCTARSRTVAATGASRTATPPGRSREITLPATLRAAA